jgi:hypothetical protein
MDFDQRLFCDSCGFEGTPMEAVEHNRKTAHLVGITENYIHRVVDVDTSAIGVTGIPTRGMAEMGYTHLYWCLWPGCPDRILDDDDDVLGHDRRHMRE